MNKRGRTFQIVCWIRVSKDNPLKTRRPLEKLDKFRRINEGRLPILHCKSKTFKNMLKKLLCSMKREFDEHLNIFSNDRYFFKL